MPTITRNGLRIWVGEMSRAAALDCAKALADFLISPPADPAQVSAEIDWLFVGYSPCKVYHNDVLLAAGVHPLDLADGDSLTLTLPLTRASFDALPVSLAAAWAEAASEVNAWLNAFFLASLRQMVNTPITNVS